MKLSDYLIEYLAKDLGISHVFMLIGGANAHIVDSLYNNKKIKHICTPHEQGAAMAAEGYARIKGDIGAALVTSGPGGTNAITGVCGAWCDSIPCIFISGQQTLKLTTNGKTIRQLGVQQINIIDIVKPVTKYAVMLTDAKKIKYHLQKAAYLAKNGRPGPVWLDIPADLQNAEIEVNKLEEFEPEKEGYTNNCDVIEKKLVQIMPLLEQAKRPILIVGHGIRLTNGEREMRKMIEKLGFPVITTWNGIDLIPSDHSLYIGRAGVIGQRGANFAVTNSDLILSIGSRMDTRQVGGKPETYAKRAKKIVVDIDRHELKKNLIHIDIPVCADAKVFMAKLLLKMKDGFKKRDISKWVIRCREWKEKYPVVLPEYLREKKRVNSYVFIDVLSDELDEGDIIVTDMGTSLTCTMQTFKVKKNQRLFTNTGFASMGFGLPATIGAWFASGKNRIIGIYGDGGVQMNIQELQTVVYNRIPAKIFILNNKGYLTIKNTQKFFFDGKIKASDFKSGYSAPDFIKVARAYGIDTEIIKNHENMRKKIKKVINHPGPILCEVEMDEDQELIPVSVVKKEGNKYLGGAMEDMYPYLSKEEFLQNILEDNE